MRSHPLWARITVSSGGRWRMPLAHSWWRADGRGGRARNYLKKTIRSSLDEIKVSDLKHKAVAEVEEAKAAIVLDTESKLGEGRLGYLGCQGQQELAGLHCAREHKGTRVAQRASKASGEDTGRFTGLVCAADFFSSQRRQAASRHGLSARRHRLLSDGYVAEKLPENARNKGGLTFFHFEEFPMANRIYVEDLDEVIHVLVASAEAEKKKLAAETVDAGRPKYGDCSRSSD